MDKLDTCITQEEDGYYWWDESEAYCYGPYTTKHEAKFHLTVYCLTHLCEKGKEPGARELFEKLGKFHTQEILKYEKKEAE